MSYLSTLADTIKNLNQVKPNHLDGLIWDERVKGCFQDEAELKKLIADAIKNEYLIFQCNSCRHYFRHSDTLATFEDDGYKAIRCKPCSKFFKQTKPSGNVIAKDILGAVRR